MKKTTICQSLIIITTLNICGEVAFTQNNAVRWYAFDMGFASSVSQHNRLCSAVGQTLVGSSQQPATLVNSGFLSGGFCLVAVPNVFAEDMPFTYALRQNYPNPFNPSTTIRFDIAHRSSVQIAVYNMLGQQVAALFNEEKEPGRYEIMWDGRNDAGAQVGSGVYFYRIQAGDPSSDAGQSFVETRKLILLR